MNRKKAQRNREYMKKVNEMRGKEHNPFKSSGKMLNSQEIKRLNDFRDSKKRLQTVFVFFSKNTGTFLNCTSIIGFILIQFN